MWSLVRYFASRFLEVGNEPKLELLTVTDSESQLRVLITDYAWESLEPEKEILRTAGAELVVAASGDEEELISLAGDVDAILTCWKTVTRKVIERAPACQIIGRYGIGLDNIDVSYATEMGIVVTNVPSYCLEEVSDQAMALLLASARKVVFFDRAIKGGEYSLQLGSPLYRIRGRTLGIFGFGKIGRTLYRKASGFGLKIIVYDPYLDPGSLEDYDVTLVDFDRLLQESDFISIHAPLSPETENLFGLSAFQKMKSTAFVINTSRGGVISSSGLLKALDDGEIAGAALDVLPEEPPPVDDPLVHHPKTIVTPHAAFYSEESVLDLQRIAATQIADVLSGKLPESVVNREVLGQPNLRASLCQ